MQYLYNAAKCLFARWGPSSATMIGLKQDIVVYDQQPFLRELLHESHRMVIGFQELSNA
jgi:hypothetical protein